MLSARKKISLYFDESLENVFRSKRIELTNKIESESENYILNVGTEQYTEFLKSEFAIEIPVIHVDKVYAESVEREISGSRFPQEDFVITNPNKLFKKDVIVYHIPYSGPIGLLQYKPSSWTSMAGYEALIDTQTMTIDIEIVNFYNDREKVKDSMKQILSFILASYPALKSDIEKYNASLPGFIHSTIASRRKQIQERSEFLFSLGVPIKMKEDTPKTFSVPKPKLREKILIKPQASSGGFKPEPALDMENYLRILTIINDVGKNFERLPSVYAGKKEEHLRDHILLTLDPNFEFGSATGETFNKKGKTDILLRHSSSVVFVAECKFWTGGKGLTSTINQLLGYLTWRDSKTSIIVFVRNKNIMPILHKAKETMKSHTKFVAEKDATNDSWFNYTFALPDDPNKEIYLALQLFHLPGLQS